MWIRSQDLRILTETHDLEVDSANQIWGSGSFIGEYSTKEKALLVLDIIQENLEYPYYEVFQMPTDTEVDEV